MPRQAITQAEHTGCDDDRAEFTVTGDRAPNIGDDDAEAAIEYDVRCTCGYTGNITVGEDGITSSDEITHENASWNTEESDDE